MLPRLPLQPLMTQEFASAMAALSAHGIRVRSASKTDASTPSLAAAVPVVPSPLLLPSPAPPIPQLACHVIPVRSAGSAFGGLEDNSLMELLVSFFTNAPTAVPDGNDGDESVKVVLKVTLTISLLCSHHCPHFSSIELCLTPIHSPPLHY